MGCGGRIAVSGCGGSGQEEPMRCPECGSEDATNIVIRLREEDSVQFYACRDCEAKWWERDGDTIDLDEVLHLTAQAERK
jgi:hypothetical protein